MLGTLFWNTVHLHLVYLSYINVSETNSHSLSFFSFLNFHEKFSPKICSYAAVFFRKKSFCTGPRRIFFCFADYLSIEKRIKMWTFPHMCFEMLMTFKFLKAKFAHQRKNNTTRWFEWFTLTISIEIDGITF